MELNKIYNEDCLQTLARMEDNSVDVVVTSPPYNKGYYAKIGGGQDGRNWDALKGGKINYDSYEDSMEPEEYEKWQREIISECIRVLRPSGSLFYNHKDILSQGLSVHPKWVYDYNVREVVIWDRFNSPQISNRFFTPITEYIWWIVKDPKSVYFDKEKAAYKSNIWRVNFEKNPHPAPFPIYLASNCILPSCPPNGVVYDPFMGSGTTAIATIQAGGGRSYVGSEISQKYIEMANERIRIELAQLSLF